jgi:hypothetical protein
MSGLIVADFIANAVFVKKEIGDGGLHGEIMKKDKTLVAFALNRPVPLQQGNYLSYRQCSKRKRKSQGDAEAI